MARPVFRFLEGEPQLQVSDVYMGERTAERTSAGDFSTGTVSAPERIEFLLDYGRRAVAAATIIRPAQGSSVAIGLHTGPF